MDIRKNVKSILFLLISTLVLSGCGALATQAVEEAPETDVRTVAFESDDEEEFIEEDEEIYIINNTVDEIVKRVEDAENGDRVGSFDDHDIYVFKCPELTAKSFFYSDSNILVRYDDYLCVKYEPEKDNEEYILLVYYFNSNGLWDSWYKYSVAKDNSEAEKIASQERDNGYTVWTYENIVMQGELFEEATITEKEFLVSFQNEKIYLKK